MVFIFGEKVIVIKRIISILITLFIVSLLVFTLEYFSLGDISSSLGDDISEESSKQILDGVGENRNFFLSYVHNFITFFSFDWGKDIRGFDYFDLLSNRLKVTFLLTLFSIIIVFPVSFLWAASAAMNENGFSEKSLTFISVILLASPAFLTSLILSLIFGVLLKWFPPSGYTSLSISISECLRSLFLPALALAILNAPILLRMIKKEINENMNKEYSLAYKAEGASRKKILFHSALKPSLPFIITLLANSICTYLSGSVVIETVFAIPGMGLLLSNAALNRDVKLASITVMSLAFIVSIVFMLSETISYFIDPRLRKRWK